MTMVPIAYKLQLLPVLNQEVSERYAIPPSSPATITYTGLPLDEIEDALQRSVAMQNARGILATPDGVGQAAPRTKAPNSWLLILVAHASQWPSPGPLASSPIRRPARSSTT